MATPLSTIMKVIHGDGDFSSKIVSLVDREPGSVLIKIEGTLVASERAYTSVQVSEDADIELNSELVYCNHSCDPSVVFDMGKSEVRIVEKRPLRKGDDITFFYPSTEWDMEQPFRCQCGKSSCVGTIKGAKYLSDVTLEMYWLNAHIERLMSSRKSDGMDGSKGGMTLSDSVMELGN